MAREQAIRFLSGIEDLPEYDKIPSFGEMSKVNPASPVKDRFVTWGLDTDNDRYWVSESRRRRNWPTLLRDPFQRHGEAP